MTSKLKSGQQFLRRHYEAFKTAFFIVMSLLLVLTFVNQFGIIQSVKDETQQQTSLINRQFEALCLVVLQTSGEDALTKLDNETEQRCRDLDAERTDRQDASQERQRDTASDPAPQTSNVARQPVAPTPEPQSEPDTAPERREPSATTEPEPRPEEPTQPESEPGLAQSTVESLTDGLHNAVSIVRNLGR